MKFSASLVLILCALFLSASAKGPPKSETAPANDEQAGLPRVLIIGDSVCVGYAPALAEQLKGKVNMYRIRQNGGPTARGVERIDAWLADGRWDAIHFNWGIQDMITGDDGKVMAAPEVYEKNLRVLVAKLKATGAKLIWATITPIPQGFGDVDGYNAIALRVMNENGVAIDDLFTAVKPHVAEYQLPQNVHYNPEGYEFIAKQVAASIEAALAVTK